MRGKKTNDETIKSYVPFVIDVCLFYSLHRIIAPNANVLLFLFSFGRLIFTAEISIICSAFFFPSAQQISFAMTLTLSC